MMNNNYSPNLPTRSTRGASKQRRDQINIEIQKLRDLLPLNGSIKDRLFQLQVMSLACIFIRKQRYFPHIAQTCEKPIYPIFHRHIPFPKQFDGCKALRGFLLIATRNGKLLYISENASEYLGYSVEEIMCQGDSIYDLVDTRDHSAVQAELSSGPPTISTATFPDERVFICRMNLSRTAKRHIQYYKFILVEGRYLHPIEYYQTLNSIPNPTAPIQPIFAAFCRPLINPENAETLSTGNTSMFRSIHCMDMKFLHLDDIGACYLGFNQHQIDGLSFYQLLHPLNVQSFSAKHRLLCQQKEGSAIALLRLQTRNGEFIWLHSVFVIKGSIIQSASTSTSSTSQPSSSTSTASTSTSSQESSPKRVRHLIHATYQVLTELEAATLQANEWIYAIKQHHFSREFSKEDFGESVSPDSSESDFNPTGDYANEASQICVEIPSKHNTANFPLQQTSHHSLMTPEQHSSPESSSSLSTAATKSFCLDSLPHFYAHDVVSSMPLPELGDDLDEFFRQVENSCSPPPAVAPQQPPPRGIKREWSEMSASGSGAWGGGEHNVHHPDPLLYGEPSIMSQYKPQRHHSIQFGHAECTWTDFNNNNNNNGNVPINPEAYHYEPFQQPHLRAQRRLGSWAGLESA